MKNILLIIMLLGLFIACNQTDSGIEKQIKGDKNKSSSVFPEKTNKETDALFGEVMNRILLPYIYHPTEEDSSKLRALNNLYPEYNYITKKTIESRDSIELKKMKDWIYYSVLSKEYFIDRYGMTEYQLRTMKELQDEYPLLIKWYDQQYNLFKDYK